MLKEESELLDEASENKAKNPKKWSSCIAQAKAKFDVYPSAYANAWAAKCYKKKKGKWKKVAENFANEILNKSILKEESNLKQLESAMDSNKNGVQQAVSYLKQFFNK
jgi:hypothetical protein